MIVPSRLLRIALPILVVLVARTSFAQTTTSGGGVMDASGGITVSLAASSTQYDNLSTYDCMHSAPIDFEFAYGAWASGQAAEFILSLSSSCDTPDNASFAGPTTCSTTTGDTDCPSMILQNNTTLTTVPADGMAIDYESVQLTSTTPNLTTGGLWGFFTTQSANMSSEATYTASISSNTTECGPAGGVDNALIYICALINAGSSGTTTTVPYGSISIALDSIAPSSPSQPTVTPLDSGLSVSWPAVSGAFYYYVHVELATTTDGGVADGGGTDAGDADAGDADGGVGADVVPAVSTSDTSATVTGLTNGTAYNVYVVAADDSGSNPPTSSNLSSPSPMQSGTPVPSYSFFQEYKGHGGAENGCSSAGGGGLVAGIILLVGLALLRRRRQRHAVTTALVALVVVVSAARVARADDGDTKPDTSVADVPNGAANLPSGFDDEDNGRPVVRKASAEWFRIDVMTGPFNPNPDQGLPAIPASSKVKGFPFQVTSNPFKAVFPATNQLLWQLQFHVNFFSAFGHLSAGLGAGFWQTSGHSLLASGSRAGDTETFTLYPITPMLGYRADFIYTKWGVPLIPYVKVGFGFVPFVDSKDGKVTSGTNADGTKWSSEGWAIGPQWAAGIEFPLDFLDPQHSIALDEDFGINSIGLMGEFGWNYWTGLNGGLPLGGWVASGGLYIAF